MQTITFQVQDSYVDNIVNILQNLKNDVIKNLSIKKNIENEEFKIDVDYCVKVAEQINNGDYSDVNSGTSQDLFNKLGI